MAVELIPFQEEAYRAYMERLREHYTADKIAAGNVSPEKAEEQIRKENDRLLPQGMQTPHHLFFTICDTEARQEVGFLWVYFDPQDDRRQAFIYDVEVHEAFRRRGYASRALLALEDRLRLLGVGKIALHVFGFNTGAQALYRKLGYEITNLNMAKQLD